MPSFGNSINATIPITRNDEPTIQNGFFNVKDRMRSYENLDNLKKRSNVLSTGFESVIIMSQIVPIKKIIGLNMKYIKF